MAMHVGWFGYLASSNFLCVIVDTRKLSATSHFQGLFTLFTHQGMEIPVPRWREMRGSRFRRWACCEIENRSAP